MLPPGPVVSFVIPVRNGGGFLSGCLASINANDYPAANIEILVADNGSTDETADVARSGGATVLSLPGLPVADVRNRAARLARGRILAFVDADHQIERGWIRAALECLQQPGVVAAGSPYHPPADGTWVQRAYDGLRDHAAELRDTEWLGSGNLAVLRDAFVAAGGFDVRLVTCEDVDLCQRLRASGGRLLDDPRMRTTHHGDPPTLAALFAGELWRGRDNFRASVRSSVTWRGLPSILIPLADLGLVVTGAVGLIGAPMGGLRLTALALLGIAGFAAVRTLVMVRRQGSPSAARAAQAFVVAAVYDVARALAPVWHGSHEARQRAGAR